MDIQNSFRDNLAAAGAIALHAINKARAAFYRAEDQVAVRQEERSVFDRLRGDAHRGRATAGWSNPQVGMAVLILHGKCDFFPVSRYGVCLFYVSPSGILLHRIFRQNLLLFPAIQVFDPQLVATRLSDGFEEIETASVRRKPWQGSGPFGGDRVVSVLIVQPHRPVLRPGRGDERLAVRRHRYSFLRRWAKGKLLWLAIRKTLPPDVEVIRSGGEIDPFPIRRPSARTTGAVGRADNSNFIRAIEWNDPAGNNFASAVHLNNEYPSGVRRKVGMMGHAAFAGGHVDVPAIPTALIGGHNLHMKPFPVYELRKEQALPSFNPGQG